MAKFDCSCGQSWNVKGGVTIRLVDGKVRKFEGEDPADVCHKCDSIVEQTKTTEGYAGIVKAHTGTVGNFKKS
jgi:hypothetical protein